MIRFFIFMLLLITGIFIFLSVYKPKTNLTPQQQVELQEELKKESFKQDRQAFMGGVTGAMGI